MRVKPIPGFPSYLATDSGEIISKKNPSKCLKATSIRRGYKSVTLCENGKRYQKSVHRLIAETFIDNPDGLPVVNHLDENKLNNSADNLEWCTYRHNNMYGTKTQRAVETRGIDSYRKLSDSAIAKTSKPVINLDTGIVYKSLSDASRQTSIQKAGICNACKGKRHTAGGYRWAYKEVS